VAALDNGETLFVAHSELDTSYPGSAHGSIGVVMNDEEQHSIWPEARENALGWREAGKQGTKAECLEYIKQVWTDMRPLSLRKKMEQTQGL